VKIEFEEYSTIEDIFPYLIAVEYTPEVKHLLPVSLYKDYVFSIVPLSPLPGEVVIMVYIKVVCSIISKSVYTSLVRRLDTRRTEIYYLVISKIVII
jgi:hypothetical protein